MWEMILPIGWMAGKVALILLGLATAFVCVVYKATCNYEGARQGFADAINGLPRRNAYQRRREPNDNVDRVACVLIGAVLGVFG